MANLIDYVTWRGDMTFNKDPFNKLDALIFAQISYVLWEGIAPEGFDNPITLAQLAKNFKNQPDYEDKIHIGFLINERTTELMFECANSVRFKDVKVCGFKSIFSEEKVEQFAAMTFIFGDTVLIAYRGTDDTIVGFEEDFRIGYKKQIPAQIYGLEYFNNVYAAFPRKNYILAGHSKGGNIAVDVAVRCEKKIQKHIKNVYNFDGPGFSLDFFEKPEFKEVKSRIKSFYPQLSVVGMLFHHSDNYEIIESVNFAIMQHDALSWKVAGCNFVTQDDFKDECKFFAQTFNNWIDQVSIEERKEFVTSLFQLLKASGYKTNTEIERNPLQASARIITAYRVMDKDKKDQFKDMFALLMSTVKSELPIFKLLNDRQLSKPKELP